MTFRSALFIFSVFLVLLAFPPAPGLAEVTQAEVTVEGMSCPFCAFGVEKKLKDVPGVAKVTVDMAGGTASLVAGEGESLDIDRINAAVKASGFTPGALKITAVGTVSSGKEGEGLLFRMRGTDQAFRLVNTPDSLRDRLHTLARSGAAVEISGEAHKHVNGLPGLEPETIEELGR